MHQSCVHQATREMTLLNNVCMYLLQNGHTCVYEFIAVQSKATQTQVAKQNVAIEKDNHPFVKGSCTQQRSCYSKPQTYTKCHTSHTAMYHLSHNMTHHHARLFSLKTIQCFMDNINYYHLHCIVSAEKTIGVSSNKWHHASSP